MGTEWTLTETFVLTGGALENTGTFERTCGQRSPNARELNLQTAYIEVQMGLAPIIGRDEARNVVGKVLQRVLWKIISPMS